MAIGRRAIKRFREGMKASAIAEGIIAHAKSGLEELDDKIGKIAEGAAEGVRQGIKQQAFEHEPLNEEYAAWKKRAGKSDRILIADGIYVDSIKATREGFLRWRVSVEPGMHPSGLEMGTLSRIFEHGTSDGIPARPHFAPAREFARGTLLRVLKDHFASERKRQRRKREPQA